jgi:hypothetical protein
VRPSYTRTVRVPDVTAGAQPVPLCHAGDRPVRVLLSSATDDLGFGAVYSISDSEGALMPDASSFTYRMIATQVFVLAQGQTLYAAAYGTSGIVGVSVSDLFLADMPLAKMRIAKTTFRTLTLSANSVPLMSAGKRAQRVVVTCHLADLVTPTAIGTTAENVGVGALIGADVLHVGAGQQLYGATAGNLVSVSTSELVSPG